jgi:hypothetical protein
MTHRSTLRLRWTKPRSTMLQKMMLKTPLLKKPMAQPKRVSGRNYSSGRERLKQLRGAKRQGQESKHAALQHPEARK